MNDGILVADALRPDCPIEFANAGFTRSYPPGWDEQVQPMHGLASAEWLDSQGQVLVQSQRDQRDLFLAQVALALHRAPRIAAHWAWLLQPLVADHPGHPGHSGLGPDVGALCYRQIEHHRMPMMAYLAPDDPRALPFADQHVADFEARHCCDRLWTSAEAAPDTRCLCSGHALLVVDRTVANFYRCAESGVLAQFRHPRPDLPHRAFPEGRAVDAQRPTGRGVKGLERPPAVQRQAFQTQHPQQL